MNDTIVVLLQLAGLGLLLLGFFLVSFPVGIAVTGLALLVIGWVLDRE